MIMISWVPSSSTPEEKQRNGCDMLPASIVFKGRSLQNGALDDSEHCKTVPPHLGVCSPTAESFGVSAQIGSGVVRGGLCFSSLPSDCKVEQSLFLAQAPNNKCHVGKIRLRLTPTRLWVGIQNANKGGGKSPPKHGNPSFGSWSDKIDSYTTNTNTRIPTAFSTMQPKSPWLRLLAVAQLNRALIPRRFDRFKPRLELLLCSPRWPGLPKTSKSSPETSAVTRFTTWKEREIHDGCNYVCEQAAPTKTNMNPRCH